MPPVAKAQQFIAPVLFTRYFFLRYNHRVKKRTFDLRYHTLKVQWKSIESSSAVACRSLSRKSPFFNSICIPFFFKRAFFISCGNQLTSPAAALIPLCGLLQAIKLCHLLNDLGLFY